MITEIRGKNGSKKLFALLLDVSDIGEGTYPVTAPSWPLQLLLMKRKSGHVVRKHMHKKLRKSSSGPMEAIVVVRGEIQANIYDRKGAPVSELSVSAGQCLLIIDGAHEVRVRKDALMYAFKDGPYKEDKIIL
ncbi:hypothetical protein A2763_02035 [Candidatus Kaiserbacteria bacterium RIFCSPHIGHO2_01_FULL_54_36]|uniref:Cupin 2 conserved barrel domain-containing protein n=1 Tax=Candidatus Kaiserbacteria bacterium RIFCSPHIGHO2_01_FULL_54_36 TaxID=1798482 RepID=A0A1F6CPL3_9BACT|nr:MAG: hypothetical protein A2763_02035 [Candidatus Kaiserbacteria bacterium RIFCSPHIGHO2_01_FULL_54_36]OGG75888.1 MAG: hypothetical protein A3A41_04505 [Candidatus Kaiserbacteria bacterium RIFCSPLOWO2_01_FULL_54_22]